MSPNVEALSQKLETLSSEQIHEVDAFVDSLRYHAEDRAFVRAASAMSEPAFAAVWDNPEDDVYDAL